MRRAGCTLALCLLAACAPRGPLHLSPAQLRSRASYPVLGPFDEAFDATWLTLEAMGWTVTEQDRQAGTFSTNIVASPDGTGRAWSASISQEGASPTVTLLPRIFEGEAEVTDDMYWTLEGPGGELQRWNNLFTRVIGLLEAWRTHPELQLDNARGEVNAAGLRMLLPQSWPHFDFSVDRRSLAVQRFKKDLGLNPTVLVRIERRQPKPDVEAFVHEALERAFRSYGTLSEPGQWRSSADSWGVTGDGEALVGSGRVAQRVRWRRWEARSPAWVVRVAAACAPEGERSCESEAHRVLESAADTHGRLVNSGGAIPTFLAR